MATEKIILDIQAEVASAKKRIKSLEQSTKAAQKETVNLEKNFQKVGATAKKLAGVFVSLYALKRVASFAAEVAKLADIQEKAEAKLLTALKGREQVQQRLIRQAQQLQKITLFGDEQTIEAQAFLAAMGLTEQAIRRLTPLVQDLATKMGSDLVSAADLIAKSVGSSTNALSRYGITIEGAVGSSERLESAIEGLNFQVGGQSEAAALVGIGAIQQFQNVLGDLKEEIAQEHLPFITALFRALTGRLAGDDILTELQIFQLSLQNETKEGLDGQLETYENFWNIQNQRFQEAYKTGNIEAQDFYDDQLDIIELYLDAVKAEIELRKEDLTITPELDERQKALLKKQEKEYQEALDTQIEAKKEFQIESDEIDVDIRERQKDLTEERKKEAEELAAFLLREEIDRAEKEKKIDRIKNNAKLEVAADTFFALSTLSKEGSELQKTLAIADTLISTYVSAQKSYEALADIPIVGPTLAAAAAATAIVLGLTNVALIAGVSFEEGGYTGKSKLDPRLKDKSGRIAGIVHEDEFVFNREKTATLRPFFEDIHNDRIDARGLAALTRRGVIVPMTTNNFNSEVLEREVEKIYRQMREKDPQRMTIETQYGYKKIIGNTTINVKS